jgi:integrase
MARTEKPVRVERGLYRAGETFLACATPPRSRTVRWKTLGEIGLMEARVQRDAWVTEVKAGRAPRAERATVEDVGAAWLAHLQARVTTGNLRERTVESYASGLNLHILPDYGQRDIRSIDVEDLVAWHARQQASGAAKWSIRARWMAWRGLMAFAVRRGFRETMPTDGLLPEERPKPGSATMRYLSREEIERMLAAARDEDDRDLIAVGVFTGMRASEILGLQLGELDFETEQIHVRWQMSRKGKRVPLKTNAGARDIVLIPALAKILRRRRLRLKRSSDNDLLFQSSTGRTMGYWVLQERFERMTKQAELKALTPHTMRHTFAAILISEGRSIAFVRDQLGHAHTSTTLDMYSHLFDAARHAQEARDGLEANFGAMLGSLERPESGA